jgi:hypothetical protein|tara:strand:- start:42 stop:257 length:216 start_codon:yes stop_codon:yes gene_type:complete
MSEKDKNYFLRIGSFIFGSWQKILVLITALFLILLFSPIILLAIGVIWAYIIGMWEGSVHQFYMLKSFLGI